MLVPKTDKRKYEKFINELDKPLKITIHKSGILIKKRAIQLLEKSKTTNKHLNKKLEQLKEKIKILKIKPKNETCFSQETPFKKTDKIKDFHIIHLINEVNKNEN